MDTGTRSAYERRNPRGIQPDSGSDDSEDSSDDEEKGLVNHATLDVQMEEECVCVCVCVCVLSTSLSFSH